MQCGQCRCTHLNISCRMCCASAIPSSSAHAACAVPQAHRLLHLTQRVLCHCRIFPITSCSVCCVSVVPSSSPHAPCAEHSAPSAPPHAACAMPRPHSRQHPRSVCRTSAGPPLSTHAACATPLSLHHHLKQSVLCLCAPSSPSHLTCAAPLCHPHHHVTQREMCICRPVTTLRSVCCTSITPSTPPNAVYTLHNPGLHQSNTARHPRQNLRARQLALPTNNITTHYPMLYFQNSQWYPLQESP